MDQTAFSSDQVLDQAEKLCHDRGVRLTRQRRKVLEILCAQGRPMGAYEVLEELSAVIPGAKPPTVYRALDFLLAQGLAHKLESLNAFIGCTHPEHPHDSQFLICCDCGEVAELEDPQVERSLGKALEECGFQAEGQVVEVTGHCARCLGQRRRCEP